MYPHEEDSFSSAEREGETPTRLNIFPSYSPLLEASFPLTFFVFTHIPSLYSCCPSCLFNQLTTTQWEQPYRFPMPAARRVCFLYKTTIPSKHRMYPGLHQSNIYQLKRHLTSVNWIFQQCFKNLNGHNFTVIWGMFMIIYNMDWTNYGRKLHWNTYMGNWLISCKSNNCAML